MASIRKGLTSFKAAATIANYLRVVYVGGNQVNVAGATGQEIGVSTGDKTQSAAGYPVPVQLLNEPGTVFLTAAGAINDGDIVYRAAGGQIADSGSEIFGQALQAAAGAGSIIEVLPFNAAGEAVRSILVPLGTIAETGSTKVTLPAPLGGTLVAAMLTASAALAANNTNYLTFSLVNKGQAGAGTNQLFSGTASATTQATGGAGIAAYTAQAIPLNATAGNLVFLQNDCLELSLAATGTLVNTVPEATVRLDYVPN